MSRHIEADRLSAWSAGDLSERDTAVVRAHVESCPECAAVALSLGAQVQALRALERADPPPSLWPAIDGALDRAERRWSWPSLVLGAFAGAAVVALAAWGVVGHRPPPDVAAASGPGGGAALAAGVVAATGAPEERDPMLAEAERELGRAASSYEQAVMRLRKILEREQERWDPETRARVGDRLARLDEAVVHSRAVAQRDPGDASGADMLFSAYRRQIDFLAEVVHRGSPAAPEGFR
jgi:Putative zinc-finger